MFFSQTLPVYGVLSLCMWWRRASRSYWTVTSPPTQHKSTASGGTLARRRALASPIPCVLINCRLSCRASSSRPTARGTRMKMHSSASSSQLVMLHNYDPPIHATVYFTKQNLAPHRLSMELLFHGIHCRYQHPVGQVTCAIYQGKQDILISRGVGCIRPSVS